MQCGLSYKTESCSLISIVKYEVEHNWCMYCIHMHFEKPWFYPGINLQQFQCCLGYIPVFLGTVFDHILRVAIGILAYSISVTFHWHSPKIKFRLRVRMSGEICE